MYSPHAIQTQWREAATVLSATSESARADSQILLCHVLGKPASYLLTWPERELSPEQLARFTELISRRAQGEPVAHIIGKRAFWTLELKVSPATLIPRPDTELLVEQALVLGERLGPESVRVLDLGTGTGAVALSIASERPKWQISAVEYQPDAVKLAQENARAHQLERVTIHQGSWFEPVAGQQFDVIVSNPPYIDADDPHLALGDVRFEPSSALVAAEQGLADIQHLIDTAPEYLEAGGWLLLEHGWQQGEAVRELFLRAGYTAVQTLQDLGGNDRVSLGQFFPG